MIINHIETFSELASIRPTRDGASFMCLERANAQYVLQASGYVALTGDVTFANGRVGALQLIGGANAYVEWFGALGSGDDTTSIQSAIDRIAAEGGGNVLAQGYYTISDTLTIDGAGVRLQGVFPQRPFDEIVSTSSSGVLYADFTSGPAILISDDSCSIKDLTIVGSAVRRAAPITTGVQNSNSGILIETADSSGDILQSVEIRNVKVANQPADGLLIEGACTNVVIDNFYSMECGRHGLAITEGDIGGRINTGQPGIILIRGGKSFDCGGHGLLIGHPNSSQFPYRVSIENRESYRVALDSGERLVTAANLIIGQNSTLANCAFEGTIAGNIADHECLELGGRDNTISDCRFIKGQSSYVVIRQQSGFSTENLKIDGAICSTTGATPPADFASIAAGADGIHILRVDHDGANPVTDIAVSSTNNDVQLHDLTENKTVYYNHIVTGLNGGGKELTITSGAITVTNAGYYKVDTESNAASDNLTDISGGNVGDIIQLRQDNSGRVVSLNHGTGNIRLKGATTFTFASSNEFISLMFDGTNWYQVAEAINNG